MLILCIFACLCSTFTFCLSCKFKKWCVCVCFLLNPALWLYFCLHCDLKHNFFYRQGQWFIVNARTVAIIALIFLFLSNRNSLLFLLIPASLTFRGLKWRILTALSAHKRLWYFNIKQRNYHIIQVCSVQKSVVYLWKWVNLNGCSVLFIKTCIISDWRCVLNKYLQCY